MPSTQSLNFSKDAIPHWPCSLPAQDFFPKAPGLPARSDEAASSRALSDQDRAKRFATLYLEDLADLIQATVSPHFALSRYAEHIARAASSFDTIIDAIAIPPTLTDQFMLESLWEHLDRVNPFACLPHCSLSRKPLWRVSDCPLDQSQRPDIAIALGGGYANTELRRLSDPRVFDYVDYVTLDDGERPLLSLIEHLAGNQTAHATLPDVLSGQGSSGLCKRYV